jgi:ribosome-associated translation inhibitor RaiA
MTLVLQGLALDDPLRALVADKLSAVVGRGGGRPTVARVAFTDDNGPKGGVHIRCAVTVEAPRRPAVHAEAVAEGPRLALDTVLEILGRELKGQRERRRDAARRPKKYFVARQALLPEGEAALPPARRRRRSA